MKKIAVVLCFSLAAVSVSAENWVQTSAIPEQKYYAYVDIDSISTQGNYKQAFAKYIIIEQDTFIISLISYDCKSNPKRSKITYIARYNLKGDTLASGVPTGTAAEFKIAIPGSYGKKEIDFVCGF